MYRRVDAIMNPETHPDLRNAVRFPLPRPVTLKTTTAEHHAETIDISAGGILFRSESEVAVGSVVEFTVAMPGDVLGSDRDVLVICQGRVGPSSRDSSGRGRSVASERTN